jgi:septal ring factor EnvC (AmiA/AmiB activator)
MRRFLYVVVFFLFFSCASKPSPTADVWTDATLIAEQRAEIESQRRTLEDMGTALESVRGNLESARIDLARATEQVADIRTIFDEIDRFVRAVIDAERQIEELQSANSGADAGTR